MDTRLRGGKNTRYFFIDRPYHVVSVIMGLD